MLQHNLESGSANAILVPLPSTPARAAASGVRLQVIQQFICKNSQRCIATAACRAAAPIYILFGAFTAFRCQVADNVPSPQGNHWQ